MSVKEKIKDLKKEHILEIATRHFRDNGYEDTKMSDVAKEAEVSIGTIYGFFENKEGVFKASLYLMIHTTHEVFQDSVRDIKEPKEKLVRFVRFKFEQMKLHKDTATELFQATPWFFSKLAVTDPFEEIISTISGYFEELDYSQPLKSKNYRQLALNFKYYTESYVVMSIKEDAEIEEDPEKIVDDFLYGVVQ